ncbi:MAG: M56 family metallopeptidase [Clostridium sp.]|nr:M56 family metallopeptidase [Clostridium sp.]
MVLGDVAVYVLYTFVVTTVTGGVFFLVWLMLRRFLGEGKELFLTRCLRIGVQFYVIPVVFVGVLWSRGDNVLFALWMAKGSPQVRTFHRSLAINALMIMLIAVWLAAAVDAFVRYRKEKRALQDVLCGIEEEENAGILACYERIRERVGIHKKITLYRSCEGSIPCTVGKLHRKILLPKREPEYSDKELEIIFAHELMHYKRHDLFFKAEFLAANLIHMVNPLMRRMKEIHAEYTEIACDLETCAKLGDLFTPKEYGWALLWTSVGPELCEDTETAGITEEKSELRKRVEIVVRYGGGKGMKKRVAVLITALFVLGSSMTAFAAGNGIVALHDGLYRVTAKATLAENGFSNTLEEHFLSAEEFAAYGSIAMESGVGIARSGTTIDWSMRAGVTYNTASTYHFKKGQVVSISAYTDPEGQDFEVGLENADTGNTVYVEATDSVSHQFTVEKEGDYYIYVKNCSNIRFTLHGIVTY